MRQPGLAHPDKLGFHGGKSILWIIIRTANEIQELAMKLGSGRSDNFQVGKHAADAELLCDFTEQISLPLVLDVVDRKSRDNYIERSKRRQRIIQVPLSNLYTIVAVESISGISEHRRRRIHCYDILDARSMFEYESRQPPVAAAQVEHGARCVRQRCHQHLLTGSPWSQATDPGQIAIHSIRVTPRGRLRNLGAQ